MSELELETPLLGLFEIGNAIGLLNRRAELRFGLSIAQWALLRRLRHMPGCSPLELAEALRLSPGSLTPSLRRLERRGFVFTADDPRDSRRKILAITRAGKERVELSSSKIEEWARGLEQLRPQISKVRACLEAGKEAGLALR